METKLDVAARVADGVEADTEVLGLMGGHAFWAAALAGVA